MNSEYEWDPLASIRDRFEEEIVFDAPPTLEQLVAFRVMAADQLSNPHTWKAFAQLMNGGLENARDIFEIIRAQNAGKRKLD